MENRNSNKKDIIKMSDQNSSLLDKTAEIIKYLIGGMFLIGMGVGSFLLLSV